MTFGVFLPNGSNGYIPSAGAPVHRPTFQHNLETTLEAGMKQGLSLSLEDGNMALMSVPAIHGSPATVAGKIDKIVAATGIDGMLFRWPDFVGGIRDFGEKVMPKLRV